MKALCFALILSQNAREDHAPPAHIQDLLKKRILYQIKQQNPDRQFYFDEGTCTVVGTYDYVDDAVQVSSSDRSVDLQLPYTDIIEGKKLELTQLGQLVEAKENMIAVATKENSLNLSDRSVPSAGSGFKKWAPWIVVGAIGLAVGGYAIYNSRDRGGGDDSGNARRRR